MKTQLGVFGFSLILVSLLLVHWILFFPVLSALGLPSLGVWCCNVTPELASYLILIVTGFAVLGIAKWSRLSPRRIPEFQQRAERLLQQGSFTDLEFYLERHLKRLAATSKGELLLQRIRKMVEPDAPLALVLAGKAEIPSSEGAIARLTNGARRRLAGLLPSYEKAHSVASVSLERILTHKPFVATLAAGNPYLGLQIIETGIYSRGAFQDLWIAALLENTDSTLYTEIEKNQQLRGWHRYEFEPQHRILSFYCRDPQTAKECGLLSSVAQHVYYVLDGYRDQSHHHDPYNRPVGHFEDDRWHDPTHAAIRMCDFVISEAVHQGLRHYGWLDYPRSLVFRFERNLHPLQEVDRSIEFPTPYHYMISQTVSFLRDCYVVAGSLDDTNPNRSVTNLDTNLDKGHSLTKALGLYLGEVYRIITLSDKLSGTFKANMLEVCLRHLENQYQEIPDSNRQFLMQAIANGGFDMLGVDVRPQYKSALFDTIDRIDDRLRYSVGRDLQKLL